MSIYVMAPVLRAQLPDIPGGPDGKGTTAQTLKLVSLALADAANEDGTGARPGVRTMAQFAQCHTDTVCRAIAHLVDLGAIELETPSGVGKAATYTVHTDWYTVRATLAGTRRPGPVRGPAAQSDDAAQPREARGPEPRKARGPEPRSNVPTSLRPPANDDEQPPCVAGCGRPALPHRTTCADCTPPPAPWDALGITAREWARRRTRPESPSDGN